MSSTHVQVRLVPNDVVFEVGPGETVLRGAERQGVSLKYGCRHGNCSTCKYLVVDGEVDHGAASPYSLSESEREDGWALLCSAVPLEDLVIEDAAPPDERARPLILPGRRQATVEAVTALGGELVELSVALDQPLEFHPGQFVELGVPGSNGEWRSYSIATAPSGSTHLGFVIEKLAGGAFSGRLGGMSAGEQLALRGPFGDAYLRSGEGPVLLVAGGGSGIAPILSIVHHAASTGDRRPFTLVYGARQRQSLVCLDQIAGVGQQIELQTICCLSEPGEGERWDGFVGSVTSAVQHHVRDASDLDAYLCGKPEMCDAVRRLLEAKGLPDGHAFADPFFSAIARSVAPAR
jgi:NAD(P)H-flavin reductase/ferredoxin